MKLLATEQEQRCDDLISELNDWGTSCNDHELSEESCVAEYTSSLGYGDGWHEVEDALKRGRLDDDISEGLTRLIAAKATKSEKIDAILEVSKLKLTGIYYNDNEIFSVTIGEIEQEIPDEFTARLETLNDDEFEYVRRKLEFFIHDRSTRQCINHAYFNHDYDRFVLVVSREKLFEVLASFDKGETP